MVEIGKWIEWEVTLLKRRDGKLVGRVNRDIQQR